MRFQTVSAVTLLFISNLAAAAMSTEPFDLEKKGSQVCKTSPGSALETCFASAEDPAVMNPPFPESVEVVDKIQACHDLDCDSVKNKQFGINDLDRVGGALFITKANKDRVLNNFQRLSVRNIAIDVNGVAKTDRETSIPFYASVYWISKSGRMQQGTVNFEGVFHLKKIKADDNGAADHEADVKKINDILASLFQINALSDSSTEQKRADLRILEKTMRSVQFKAMSGQDTDVDAETAKLMQEVVGPFVIGDVIFVPMVKAFAHALGDAMGQMFQGLTGEPAPHVEKF